MAKVSLEKDKIKFLLVEGVHQKAIDSLRAAGYTNIEFHKGALDTEELKASIRDAHFIGLRSRTHLTEELLPRRKSWLRLAASASVPTRLI
jgi:D-3-phosphoglycerate dehydrogenase